MMIIETRFIAENKRERKALQMMSINMQESGMDVEFYDAPEANAAHLTIKEAHRKRRSRQEIAEAALAAGEAHP